MNAFPKSLIKKQDSDCEVLLAKKHQMHLKRNQVLLHVERIGASFSTNSINVICTCLTSNTFLILSQCV
jgi:hypothetical protein